VRHDILTDANAPAHYSLLDSGSFDVQDGRIIQGKAISDGPIPVGGFKGQQVRFHNLLTLLCYFVLDGFFSMPGHCTVDQM
jgi:hypothetical protein